MKPSLNADVKLNPISNRIEQFLWDFIYGALSAGISKTSVAPIERLKLLLQTRFINYNANLLNITKDIIKEQGILSFWRGYDMIQLFYILLCQHDYHIIYIYNL